MSLGDDPNQRAAWQRAVNAARRAYERAEQLVAEVRRLTSQRLARLWDVTTAVAEATKATVVDQFNLTVERAKTAVRTAGVVLAGLLGVSASVMFSGWVILAAFAVWYLSGKNR